MSRKMFPLVIFALFGAVIFLPTSEGLECYSCWSEASQTPESYKQFPSYGIPGHSSCGKGKVPEGNLTRTCLPTKDALGREMQPVCVQFYVDFLSHQTLTSSAIEYKVAFRSCFFADPTIDPNVTKGESCASKTQKEVEAIPRSGPLGVILRPFYKSPTNLTAEFCNCNVDLCVAKMVPEDELGFKHESGNNDKAVENNKGPTQKEGSSVPIREGVIRTTVTAHILVTDKMPPPIKEEGRAGRTSTDAEVGVISLENGSKLDSSGSTAANGVNVNCKGGGGDDDANPKCGSSASLLSDGKLSLSVWATVVASTMIFFHCIFQ